MRLKTSPLRGRRLGTAVLAAPAVILYLSFIIVPLGVAVYYSTTDWNGVRANIDSVGFQNYRDAFASDRVRDAFRITGLIALTATIILNVIALPLAVLLNRSDRITRFYRSAVFFPIVLSTIVVGFVWQAFLSTTGTFNSLLSKVDLGPIIFLGEAGNAQASITFVAMWQTLGFLTVLYLAALQTIPSEIYEAAEMDGASSLSTFLRITLPMLAPAVLSNVILLMIFFMRIYEYVAAMTQGGPAGKTETVSYLVVQQAFGQGNYGLGSATAILLVASILMVVVIFGLLGSRLEKAAGR